jgi:hypothetical protein
MNESRLLLLRGCGGEADRGEADRREFHQRLPADRNDHVMPQE